MSWICTALLPPPPLPLLSPLAWLCRARMEWRNESERGNGSQGEWIGASSSSSAEPDGEWELVLLSGSLALCCGMGVLTLVGAVGNGLSLRIFLHRANRRNAVNILLAGLAVFDIAMLVCSTAVFFPLSLYNFLSFPSGPSNHVLQNISPVLAYVCKYIYPLAMVAQTGSIWTLVVITLERFMAVCFPFLAKDFCSTGRTKLFLAGVVLFAFLYNSCRFFEYSIAFITIEEQVLAVPVEALRRNSTYHSLYIIWAYFLIMFTLPMAAVSILTFFILSAIRAARLSRRKMSAQEDRENSTTQMLLVVQFIFLFTQLLPLVLAIIEIDVSKTGVRKSGWFFFLTDLSNFLVEFNSSCNFLIYLRYNARFRRQFRSVLAGRGIPGHSVRPSLNTSTPPPSPETTKPTALVGSWPGVG